MRSSIVDFFNEQPIDQRVPSWDGTGEAIGLDMYERLCFAYQASLEDDKVKLCGPRLWSNLRGPAREAVEKLSMDTLRDPQSGVASLIATLKGRWPEGPLRKLPRLYKALFKEIQHRPGQDVSTMCADMERARQELEHADPQSKVSTGVLGYFLLDKLEMTDAEQAHILGLTGFSLEYEKIRAVVNELYPRGSHQKREHQRQKGVPQWGNHWRQSYFAEEQDAYDHDYEENDYDETMTYDEEVDAESTYEDDAWHDQAERDLVDATEHLAAYVEQAGDDPTSEDKEQMVSATAFAADALLNMRDAKHHMNEVRVARGFFPTSPTPKGKSKGKRKGKGKKGRKGKSSSSGSSATGMQDKKK